jgi:hypothetical protein
MRDIFNVFRFEVRGAKEERAKGERDNSHKAEKESEKSLSEKAVHVCSIQAKQKLPQEGEFLLLVL